MLFTWQYRVIASKNGKYPLGTRVVAYWGWRNLTVVNPDDAPEGMMGSIFPLPDLGVLSPSLGLGAVGMPGFVHYIF